MIHGVDVSSYQPADFSTSGLAFAFTKATEGTGYVNPEQAAQAAHARAAGLVVGFYHFLQPGDMTAQAEYFVTHAASQPGDILAADWEVSGVSSADKDAFLRAVKALRPTHKLVLYCDTSFWRDVDTSGYVADGLWIADYTTPGAPRIQHPWVLHQYTDTAPQGGDGDVANFPSVAAMRTWATGSQPAPTPAPKPPPAPTPTPAPSTEDDMPRFTVTPGGALCGTSFARGSARTVGFFTDNTLVAANPNDPGASLRVVIWSDVHGADIHDIVVGNKAGKQTVINFADPSSTHSVTVTRIDKGAGYPVFAEVS